eukprot:TRINITY_DN12989_c0_g1_i1.p1 TRINITY_DN12989_c0_g1~~TRINITY_DN12989_c0_g1_i1.p1  ORF type:complete len:507 (+),score=97.03 TRINITY_DN12989_c0_g1_i1:66-1586(+)
MSDSNGKKVSFLKVTNEVGRNYKLEINGDMTLVTATMLKPKLADHSGIDPKKQQLLFKGKEISDYIPFDQLGIRADDELKLTIRPPETEYYTGLINDGLQTFDKLLSEGDVDISRLPPEEKEKKIKLLQTKAKSLSKNTDLLKDEISCVRDETQKQQFLEQLSTLESEVQSRIWELNKLDGSASETAMSPKRVNPLRRLQAATLSDLKFSNTMLLFLQQITSIYDLLIDKTITTKLELCSTAIQIATLWEASATTSSTPVELAMMEDMCSGAGRHVLMYLPRVKAQPIEGTVQTMKTYFASLPFSLPNSHKPTNDLISFLYSNTATMATATAAVDAVLLSDLRPPTGLMNSRKPLVTEPTPSAEQKPNTAAAVATQKAASAPDTTTPVTATNNDANGNAEQPSSPSAIYSVDDVAVALKNGSIWRAKLILFYINHCPSKLSDIDNILSGYAGVEEKLFELLFQKYEISLTGKEELQEELLSIAKANNVPTEGIAVHGNSDGGCSVM